MEIKKIDKAGMRETLLNMPKQFRAGIEAAQGISLKTEHSFKPENIIICGMGGSGMPGEILATLRPLDIFIYKSYRLPPQAGKKSLVICISYSGNTEETVSAFETAIGKNLPVICITTGGKLAELSQKYQTPVVILPKPYCPPRLALAQMFAALVKVLQNHELLDEELLGSILALEKNLSVEKIENQGKKLAKKFFKKIPIIYTSSRFQEIGWIWKNSLNETAKIIAFCNFFPELNHNETVGFEEINRDQVSNKKISVVILRDQESSHPRILKQMEITKGLIEKEGVAVEFVEIEGNDILEKIFSSAVLGLWTAYWLAIEYGVDPTEIKTIEEFKKRLKEE